MILLH